MVDRESTRQLARGRTPRPPGPSQVRSILTREPAQETPPFVSLLVHPGLLSSIVPV